VNLAPNQQTNLKVLNNRKRFQNEPRLSVLGSCLWVLWPSCVRWTCVWPRTKFPLFPGHSKTAREGWDNLQSVDWSHVHLHRCCAADPHPPGYWVMLVPILYHNGQQSVKTSTKVLEC